MKEALEARPHPNRRVPCRATASLCRPRPVGSAPTSTTENIKKMTKFACSWKTWDVGSKVQGRSFTQSPWSSESALTSKWEVASTPTCKARAATQLCTGCLVLNTTLLGYKRPQHACDIQAPYLYLTCAFQRDVPSYRLQTCAAAAVHRNTMLGPKQHLTDQEQLVGC